MKTNNNKLMFTARTLSLLCLFASGAIAAGRDAVPGYLVYGDNEVVRTKSGVCVHTTEWAPENATIVGCDGYVVNPEIQLIRGQRSGLLTELSIPAATLFAFDSDVVTDEGKQAIEELRETVTPELAEAYAVVVIGHTDSRGDENYNIDLSKRRAENVRQYLVATGVPEAKLRVVGRGAKDPIVSNDTDAGRAQNRRVELIVIGEVRALDALRFSSVALFPRRSAELTPDGKALLDLNIREAREMLRRASYIEVVGHTDDVGDDNYNYDLSGQRARAVRDYLVRAGVDPSKLATVGMGETMPIASNNTPEGRADNRRVEILLLGRLK